MQRIPIFVGLVSLLEVIQVYSQPGADFLGGVQRGAHPQEKNQKWRANCTLLLLSTRFKKDFS